MAGDLIVLSRSGSFRLVKPTRAGFCSGPCGVGGGIVSHTEEAGLLGAGLLLTEGFLGFSCEGLTGDLVMCSVRDWKFVSGGGPPRLAVACRLCVPFCCGVPPARFRMLR